MADNPLGRLRHHVTGAIERGEKVAIEEQRVRQSGYTACACRDCFDIAVSDDMAKPDLCGDCEEAGCDAAGESECARSDAYGCEGDE